MPIPVHCPQCRTLYQVGEQLRGKRVRCKSCQETFLIPASPAAAAEPRPRPAADEASAPRPVRREGRSVRRKKAVARKGSPVVSVLTIGGATVAVAVGMAAIGLIGFKLFGPKDGSALATGPVAPPDQEPAPYVAASPRPPAVVIRPPEEPLARAARVSPAAEPPAAERSGTTPSSSRVVSAGGLTPEVLERLKRATVMLQVTVADGKSGSGSGFFAQDPSGPGLAHVIFTNAHVLGMKGGEAARPQRVEVVLHSGRPDEQTLPGTILAVDGDADLAVVQVSGAGAKPLPAPLPLRPASALFETQPVYIVGFPFGNMIGKEVTVSPSSVSSLRKDDGRLTRIQLNGGMHPGNSGGPVVDADGNVIGVAVSGIRNTQIDFAIPTEAVSEVLHGRLGLASFSPPRRKGSNTSVDVDVQVVDPHGNVRSAVVDWWLADAGQDPAQGADRQTTALALAKGTAHAELDIPGEPIGRVLWIESHGLDASGRPVAGTRQSHPLRDLVEPDRPPLEIAFPAGQSNLEITCHSALNRKDGNTITTEVSMTVHETVRTDGAGGGTSVRLTFPRFHASVSFSHAPRDNLSTDTAAGLALEATPLSDGRYGNLHADLTRVRRGARGMAEGLAPLIEQILENALVPVEKMGAKPSDGWTRQGMSTPLFLPSSAKGPEMAMHYTYLRTRQRDGRREAVIQAGVDPADGLGDGKTEPVKGSASVDIATMRQVRVQLSYTFDLISGGDDGKMPVTLKAELSMHRDRP